MVNFDGVQQGYFFLDIKLRIGVGVADIPGYAQAEVGSLPHVENMSIRNTDFANKIARLYFHTCFLFALIICFIFI